MANLWFRGGTILAQLRSSTREDVKSLSITALVRTQSQADFLKTNGVEAVVLEGGLDDVEGLAKLASQYDTVLHAATGFHTASAEALITGLSKRKSNADVSPIYLHVRLNLQHSP